MGSYNGDKEINHIDINEKLTLLSNVNNEIVVYLTNIHNIKTEIKRISVGKHCFDRFKKLIYKRYIPEKKFFNNNL